MVATGSGGAISYGGAEAVDWEVGGEGGRKDARMQGCEGGLYGEITTSEGMKES